MKKSRDLTQGNIKRLLTKLTGPMVIGILSILTFHLVDTYFIGQLGGDQLAGVSFTFPVVLLVISLTQGIGIGTMTLVSTSIGKKLYRRAALETTTGLLIALVLVIFFSVMGILTIDPVFRAMGATDRSLPYIRDYMEIWYIAIMFLIIPMVGSNAIRAAGDTVVPSVLMFTSVVLNLILDPLLIFGYGPFPEMGVRGAALASAISRGVTLVASIWVLAVREKLISFRFPSWQVFREHLNAIMYIGLPSSGSKMITPLGIGVMTGIVAQYGEPAVAAFGVGFRIERFALSVVNALATVMGPFVGQNIGAHFYQRVRDAFRFSFRFSILYGLVLSGLIALAAPYVANIFTDDPEIIRYLKLFLYIIPISYTLRGIFQIVVMCLNTLRRPLHAASLSVVQMVFLSVPLSWLASRYLDVWGVFAALMISYLLSGFIALYINKREFEKIAAERERKTKEQKAPPKQAVAK